MFSGSATAGIPGDQTTIIRSRVAADWSIAALTGPSPTLNLFDNVNIPVTWIAVEPSLLSPTLIVYRAAGINCGGCNAAMIVSNGKLSGFVATEGHFYTVRQNQKATLDKEIIISEVVQNAGGPDTSKLASDAIVSQGTNGVPTQTVGTSTNVTLDILSIVSPQLVALDSNLFHRTEALAYYNNAQFNSGVGITARYVGEMEFQDLETRPGDIQAIFNRLWIKNDGIYDSIHQEKDRVGADLVAAFITRSPSSPSGVADILYNLNYIYESTGFSVNQLNEQIFTRETFAHELGHNGGAGHSTSDSTSFGLFPYSRGHQDNTGAAHFRTIMTYGVYCAPPCQSSNSYSAPERLFLGRPTGIADVSDNAKTQRLAANFLSEIRPTGGVGSQVDIYVNNGPPFSLLPINPQNPVQGHRRSFCASNNGVSNAQNVVITIDVDIDRNRDHTLVFVDQNGNPCSQVSTSDFIDRYICNIGDISTNQTGCADARWFNGRNQAIPAKFTTLAFPANGDYRPANNTIIEQIVLPF